MPGCQSGYKEAVQSFPYPKDEKRKKQWLQQIGLKKVGKFAVVCKLHFLDSYIIPAGENVTKKGIKASFDRLRKQAVPTVFPLGPKKSKRRIIREAKTVPETIVRPDHSYVKKVKEPEHLVGFGSVQPSTSVPMTTPASSDMPASKIDLPSPTMPTTVELDLTPPPTPVNISKPTRFAFSEPPTASLPQQQPESSTRDLIKGFNERILQLEREINELRDVIDCFKSIFNEDQIDILVGKKKRVNWSDKTKTESMETRYVCGHTGYDHIREKFPGNM